MRFLAEAEAIARVKHPGIVQVYDFGTHEGLPYFSLELCEGGSLADKLRGGPLKPAEAAALVEQVARAMQAAHDAGIVHRDLKPGNVLLQEEGTTNHTNHTKEDRKENQESEESSSSFRVIRVFRGSSFVPKVTDSAKKRSRSMATVTTPMTTEEFLALPDDGTERWLVDGQVIEWPKEDPMTVRNRFHSTVLISVGTELKIWLRQQPPPRGQVLGGEAGVRLMHDPDVTVGIDVVYVSSEVLVRQTDDTTLIDGVPTLAVEILSPNDTVEEIDEKLALYRRAGVPLVWVIDPYVQTVTVHSANNKPVLFNTDQELSAEPHLPGLRVPVSRLFE